MLEMTADIARAAGDAILEVYGDEDFGVETKDDDSPLTRADLAAHHIIVGELQRKFPDIPVLSEESAEIPFVERQKWHRYFLVDPLDGTKEFISRNGEFTVNIAFIEKGIPTLGVVHVPVQGVTYLGDSTGAYRQRNGERVTIGARHLATRLQENKALTVVASRRHGSEAMDTLMAHLAGKFANIETTNMGSSLKLCLVAAGEADLYPRMAPTSEWDTAAAQAVVEAAGGQVLDATLQPLRYNGKESLLNPYFYVLGDPEYPWKDILPGDAG